MFKWLGMKPITLEVQFTIFPVRTMWAVTSSFSITWPLLVFSKVMMLLYLLQLIFWHLRPFHEMTGHGFESQILNL